MVTLSTLCFFFCIFLLAFDKNFPHALFHTASKWFIFCVCMCVYDTEKFKPLETIQCVSLQPSSTIIWYVNVTENVVVIVIFGGKSPEWRRAWVGGMVVMKIVTFFSACVLSFSFFIFIISFFLSLFSHGIYVVWTKKWKNNKTKFFFFPLFQLLFSFHFLIFCILFAFVGIGIFYLALFFSLFGFFPSNNYIETKIARSALENFLFLVLSLAPRIVVVVVVVVYTFYNRLSLT